MSRGDALYQSYKNYPSDVSLRLPPRFLHLLALGHTPYLATVICLAGKGSKFVL